MEKSSCPLFSSCIHNCRIYVKRTGFSSFSPLSEWIIFFLTPKGKKGFWFSPQALVSFRCSTAWDWWLQLRSLESKLGMLSPLSKYYATEAGRSVASSQYAHRSEYKPETPYHVAAPSCLLCILLPDFSSNTKERKRQKHSLLKNVLYEHTSNFHALTWKSF